MHREGRGKEKGKRSRARGSIGVGWISIFSSTIVGSLTTGARNSRPSTSFGSRWTKAWFYRAVTRKKCLKIWGSLWIVLLLSDSRNNFANTATSSRIQSTKPINWWSINPRGWSWVQRLRRAFLILPPPSPFHFGSRGQSTPASAPIM